MPSDPEDFDADAEADSEDSADDAAYRTTKAVQKKLWSAAQFPAGFRGAQNWDNDNLKAGSPRE